VTNYRLRITSGNRTVLAIDSVGDRYAPEPAVIAPYDSLEWTLEAEGTVIRGKIMIGDQVIQKSMRNKQDITVMKRRDAMHYTVCFVSLKVVNKPNNTTEKKE
jgi:hypothetical protein